MPGLLDEVVGATPGLLHNPDLLAQQMQRGLLGLRPGGGGVPPIPRAAPAIAPGSTIVSTRFPTAVSRAQDPLQVRLQSGDLPAYRANPTYEQNISLLHTYPGFRRLKEMSPREAEKAYIDQATKNLMFLHERAPPVMKEGSPLWYHGASRFSEAQAEKFGIPKQSSSAAIAALSPQQLWDINASLAERVGNVIFSPVASKRMTTDMKNSFSTMGKEMQSDPGVQLLMRRIEGKSFSQITDPVEQALWIRLYDRAHNSPDFRTIAPDGGLGPFAMTKQGERAKIRWGSLTDITKAIQAYQSGGDMSIISPLLGGKHKVRNFYMDVQHPTRPDAGVTGDTHQVAGAQLRPLSGASPAVGHHLASPVAAGTPRAATSDVSGFKGTYPLVEQATRNVAKQTGLLAHEAQSSTWEPVRQLFSPRFKNAANAAKVDSIWREYDAGKITFKGAQEAIYKLAGGIGTPSWARPGVRLYDPRKASTYR